MTVHRLTNPAARYWFWHDARAKLGSIPMDAPTRRRCEAALAAVVPPPTEEEAVNLEAKMSALREKGYV